MNTAVDVHTKQDLEGDRRGMLALQEDRQAANLQPLPDHDLVADMPEEDFERALVRIKTRQSRMQKIIDTVLIEGAHYGNPTDSRGNKAFKQPILLQAGAEELRNFFRLTPRHLEPMQITESAAYVSVTVMLGMYDGAGRLLGTKPGSCNSMEKRFRKFNGNGYTYTDAREVLHDCIAMAEKRANTRLTREVTGGTAFFANRDEMEDGLEPDDKPITPWTDVEKKQVYAAAQKKGLGRSAFAKLALEALGREQIGSGEDVAQLMEAIAKYQKPRGPKAVADANDGYGEAAAPEQAAPEPEPIDDAALDAEIAQAEQGDAFEPEASR